MADSDRYLGGQLSDHYLESYHGSLGIAQEHKLDALAVLQAIHTLPGLTSVLATRPYISTFDIGSGEGSKSEIILRSLMKKFHKDRGFLHTIDPDEVQIELLRTRIANEPAGVHVDATVGRIDDHLDKYVKMVEECDYVTCFHILYYLAQEYDDLGIHIPTLTRILRVTPVPLFLITEGWGQLQSLKWHMHHVYTDEFEIPASTKMVVNSLHHVDARFFQITIPNRWPVRMMHYDPVKMFREDFEFLLAGNYGCPPLTDEYRRTAGEWILQNASIDREGHYLNGPDALFVIFPKGW